MSRPTIKLPAAIIAVHTVERGQAATGDLASPTYEAAVVAMQTEMQQQLAGGMAQINSARQALAAAADEFRRAQEQLVGELEQNVVKLALEVAHKVLMREVQAGNYQIEAIIKEALLHVSVRKNVVVRLNPEDYAVCEMDQQSGGAAPNAGDLHVIADPMVPRAACVLETSQGVVESSVEGHLDEISKALQGTE